MNATKTRNVICALIGAGALVLASSYNGPYDQVVHAYGGNFAVSFALYFAVLSGTHGNRRPRLGAVLITLLAVTAFELTDGFGFMANVYDPVDIVADAGGVGLAVVVDLLSSRWMTGEPPGGLTRA